MAKTIPQFIDKYKDVEDKGLLWEMVKMEIRSFTITFDSLRRKQKNVEIKKNSSLKKLKDCKIWWTVNQHLSTSTSI